MYVHRMAFRQGNVSTVLCTLHRASADSCTECVNDYIKAVPFLVNWDGSGTWMEALRMSWLGFITFGRYELEDTGRCELSHMYCTGQCISVWFYG